MSRSSSYSREPFTLTFPPFTRAVAWLIGINTALYVLIELLDLSRQTGPLALKIAAAASLTPSIVVHHAWVWQLATFSFIHLSIWYLLILMLQLWMFGAQVEQMWGPRRLLGLYFTSGIGAGLFTVGLAYSGLPGLSPGATVNGAAAALFGVLIAFGVLFAEQEIFLLLPPVSIKAKYFAWILIVITFALALSQSNAAMAVPQLGGIIFGYLYVKMQQHRRVAVAYGGRAYAKATAQRQAPLLTRWRDSYYRWKRRRAARKFEVYMRKYDRKVFFDEHGNYIEPDSPEARDRDGENGKSGWVN